MKIPIKRFAKKQIKSESFVTIFPFSIEYDENPVNFNNLTANVA
jgi:hypothetical protein